jgi:hypothetical protein
MAHSVVTSIGGKAIQVNEDGRGTFALLIDGNIHSSVSESMFKIKPDNPVIKLDFPFSDGTKTIEVFGKTGLASIKCKIHLNGQYIAGDKF